MRWTVGRARGAKALLVAGAVALSLFARRASPDASAKVTPAPATPAAPARARAEAPPVAPLVVPWARDLAPIHIVNPNARLRGDVRLYARDGSVDLAALAEFRRLVGDGEHEAPLAERTVQLALKAAYHFGGKPLVLISAYRPSRHKGPHATGRAIDFQLTGVSAAKVASYLRTFPRAGVGIYTNPKTQFVHLDVRDMSWHWLDASPPRKHWRERPLPDRHREERDASYTPESDLPEAASKS